MQFGMLYTDMGNRDYSARLLHNLQVTTVHDVFT